MYSEGSSLRKKEFREEKSVIKEGIFVYPFFWAKECDIHTAFKKIVPFRDILDTNYRNMLAINGASDDT